MDMDFLRSFETVALLVLFLGLVYIVYIKTDKRAFDEAANLPFSGDETSNKIEHNQKKGADHE